MPIAKIAPVWDDRGRKNYAVHVFLTPDDGPEDRERLPRGSGFMGHFQTRELAARAACGQGFTVDHEGADGAQN